MPEVVASVAAVFATLSTSTFGAPLMIAMPPEMAPSTRPLFNASFRLWPDINPAPVPVIAPVMAALAAAFVIPT